MDTKFIYKTLGARLLAARIDKGFTQAELAAAVDSKQSNVSKWESGKAVPRYTTLYKISKILGIAVHDLIPERQDAA